VKSKRAVTNLIYQHIRGGSGVLDVAREVQLRIKHWAYAYPVGQY